MSAARIRAIAVEVLGAINGGTCDRVILDFDARHRRRIAMRGEGGIEFLLDVLLGRLRLLGRFSLGGCDASLGGCRFRQSAGCQ